MSNATATQPARALPPVAAAMLESLGAHRLLTAGQLRELHAPHASLRWTHRALARLASHGLVDFARAGRGGRRVYHLTADGINAVSAPERTGRPRPRTRPPVAGPLTAHTVAVNDAAIVFVKCARGRGDECGPLAWRHEVAHPTSSPAPGQRRALVIADALLTYLEHRDQGELAFHYRFLELDRATQPTNLLAAKLARYTDLQTYTAKGARRPAWQEHYPVFPEVLCVLTGAPRPALERRARTVLALYAAHPGVDPHVVVSICLLDDLTRRGPWAPVFQRPQDPDRRVDWLGVPA
jgi:hypothetical protein